MGVYRSVYMHEPHFYSNWNFTQNYSKSKCTAQCRMDRKVCDGSRSSPTEIRHWTVLIALIFRTFLFAFELFSLHCHTAIFDQSMSYSFRRRREFFVIFWSQNREADKWIIECGKNILTPPQFHRFGSVIFFAFHLLRVRLTSEFITLSFCVQSGKCLFWS